MNCIEIEKQIDSLIDSDIYSVIEEEIKNHLKECLICEQKYEKLFAVNRVLSSAASVPNSKNFDARVMNAFRHYHSKKPETKETIGWITRLTGFAVLPKIATAVPALLFIVTAVTAFQIGRISATDVHIAITSSEDNRYPASGLNDERISSNESQQNENTNKTDTKFLNVPVVKERFIKRIVYVNSESKRLQRKNTGSTIPQKDNLAIKSLMLRNEYLTEVNLKGFQLISNSKVRIIKKGENDEN